MIYIIAWVIICGVYLWLWLPGKEEKQNFKQTTKEELDEFNKAINHYTQFYAEKYGKPKDNG